MAAAALVLAGCASNGTILSRKQERQAAYAALTPEFKQLVDTGQIKVGMPEDAVYISWGPPDQVTENEDASGHTRIWIYMGQWMEESRYWNHREIRRDNTVYMERFVDRDYNPRSYVSAELCFQNSKLISWRSLPRPTN
jgi:hypothetical protein